MCYMGGTLSTEKLLEVKFLYSNKAYFHIKNKFLCELSLFLHFMTRPRETFLNLFDGRFMNLNRITRYI